MIDMLTKNTGVSIGLLTGLLVFFFNVGLNKQAGDVNSAEIKQLREDQKDLNKVLHKIDNRLSRIEGALEIKVAE